MCLRNYRPIEYQKLHIRQFFSAEREIRSADFYLRRQMNTVYINDRIQIPFSDLQFRYSRSGGPGGQNVNKVSTRVELLFDVRLSTLDPESQSMIAEALGPKLDSAGRLRVISQESRSQWKNKQDAIEKFIFMVQKAMRPVKHRTPTAATKGSKRERLAAKKGRSEVKKMRKIDIDEELR